MRYNCDDPAFEHDYIEFSDTWSRAQVRSTWATVLPDEDGKVADDAEERLLACLRPKIVALYLSCVDAPPITDPSDLTPERTEEMDTRLYTWFADRWAIHLRNLADLGNALRRKLYDTSAVTVNGMEKETADAP